MLRSRDVRRQGLVLPDLKNPVAPIEDGTLAAAHAGLPGELLLGRASTTCRMRNRSSSPTARRGWWTGRPLTAWAPGGSSKPLPSARISTCSPVCASSHRQIGEPVPVHRICSAMRACDRLSVTPSALTLAQKQAGLASLHTEYLTLIEDEARVLMEAVLAE